MRRKRPTLAEMDQLRRQLDAAQINLRTASRNYLAELEAHGRTLKRLEIERESRERAERAVILKTRMPDKLPDGAVGMARCEIEVEFSSRFGERDDYFEPPTILSRGGKVTGELEILYLDESADPAINAPCLTLTAGRALLRVATNAMTAIDNDHPMHQPCGLSLRTRFRGLKTGDLSAVDAANELIREMRENIVFIMAAEPQKQE